LGQVKHAESGSNLCTCRVLGRDSLQLACQEPQPFADQSELVTGHPTDVKTLINANAFEESVHSPQRHTILPHRAAQFVICSQISVSGNDRVSPAVYGCSEDRVILGVAAPRWHRGEFHHIAAKAQLLQQSLRIL
jgi:hypothetical protein